MHAGTVIADRFRIVGLARKGGMGSVYRARDLMRDVDVAVKLSHRLAGGHEARRMMREAQALAERLMELRHPHIVEYVAHGIADADQPYLVMEWLEGHDLATRLRQGPLAEADVVALALTVARTLSLVHGCGIVHRDIKPGNLFVVGGDLACVKLIDFGFVHMDQASSSLTPTGMFLGTPGYMAPEQIEEARAVDGRADLYALGGVMFACLTQRLPFEGTHFMSVLGKVMLEEAPRVHEFRGDVSPALGALIARLLRKKPADRPPSADALAAELDRLHGFTHDGMPAPLHAQTAVSHGEQRFFTVLLAGPLPSDKTASLVAHVQRIAGHGAEVVRLADGTLLAIFGGGSTLDDTAVRAARCALAMRETGMVAPMVVATGRGRTDTRQPVGEVIERAVALRFGDALHSAQTLAVAADTLPGVSLTGEGRQEPSRSTDQASAAAENPFEGILVDDVTANLVASRFEIGPHTGPGFRLLAETPAPPAGLALEAALGPCVGREREITAIEALLDECIEESVPRIMLVSGPPGLGKSRLASELVQRLAARGLAASQIWCAGGDPMRVGSPLGLLGRLIAHAAGMLPGASPDHQRAAVARRVRARVSGDDAERIIVFMSEIIGAPFGDDAALQLREARREARLMHDQMLHAWESWLDAAAEAEPVVLVLDDLHWADLPSVRFIEKVLRNLCGRPIFVLALARLDIDEVFPDLWATCQPERMLLRPLPRQACMELAELHAASAMDPEALARLVDRAGGNPFYLEELLQYAGDGDSEVLPDTLLALVGARLASLPADERRMLRAASVFGHRFSTRGVAALLGEDAGAGTAAGALVERLLARDLVLPERRTRAAGEQAYRFRHDLLREAAYATLPDDDRVRAHRGAAAWLEQAGERDAYVLAEHYWHGRAAARALPWFCRAAEQALAADDVKAVLERVERAMACGAGGATLGALQLLQAEAQNWSAQHQAAHASAVRAMEHLPHGSDAWAQAAHQRMWAAADLGYSDDTASVGEQILACVTRPLSDAFQIALAHCVTNLRLYGHRRQVGQALTYLEPEPRMNTPSVAGAILHMRAALATFDGYTALAATWFGEAIEQWDAAGNKRQACMDRSNLGVCLGELGQYEECIQHCRSSLDQARRLGIEHAIYGSSNRLVLTLSRQGEHREAERLFHETPQPTVRKRMQVGTLRAWLALLASRSADALAEADRVLAGMDGSSPRDDRVLTLAIRARALLELGRPHEALEAAQPAMALLQEAGAIEEGESLVRLTHAETLLATGKVAEARAVIAAAHEWLLDKAAHIDNPAWRRSFLDRVAENRRIIELASSRAGSSGQPGS
jgi:tetratricopeptide (TPR) repeat protein